MQTHMTTKICSYLSGHNNKKKIRNNKNINNSIMFLKMAKGKSVYKPTST